MSTIYDFSAARAECEAKGLYWSSDFETEADKVLASVDLTQPQVDAVARLHLDYVSYLFTPKTYSCRQRIGLAWHFLFGEGLR